MRGKEKEWEGEKRGEEEQGHEEGRRGILQTRCQSKLRNQKGPKGESILSKTHYEEGHSTNQVETF